MVDMELSIGDYVLSGGELPAMVVIDAVLRLLPGAIDEQSPLEESFADGLLEYPQYTRPADFEGQRVPDILLSGDHGAVDRWRREQAIARTRAAPARSAGRRRSPVGSFAVSDGTPYIHLPGTAREALTFYGAVFGCAVRLHTFAEMNRTDAPADGIAHGYLADGPVALFAADVVGDEPAFRCQGMMLALLGTAPPSVLRRWFARLSEGGRVVDDLQARPWGASDGQVIDRYGLHWLIGFEVEDDD